MTSTNKILLRIAQCWAARRAEANRLSRRLKVRQAEKSRGEISSLPIAPPLSAQNINEIISVQMINEALSTLPPRLRDILIKRCGFFPTGKFHTLEQISERLGITGERVRQLSLKALRRLRHPEISDKLRGMHSSINSVAAKLMEDRIVLTPDELKTALKNRSLLRPEDDACFLPILHLFDGIFPDRFTYIDMKSGRIAKDMTQANIWLVKDRRTYLEVLPEFCKEKRASKKSEKLSWKFKEYQLMLYEKHHLFVSIQELKRIFEAHSEIVVEGDTFSTVDKTEKTFFLVSERMKEKGPLHYKEVAAFLDKKPSSAHTLLHSHPQFVLVGNGIFDLLERHPEQKDIPYPKVKRKSPVFGPVYGILREAKDRLTPKGIHRRMQKRGYKWSLTAVNRILRRDKNYSVFFEEKGGRYGIRAAKLVMGRPPVSLPAINKAISSLPAEMGKALKLRYGLDPSARFRSFPRVAESFWVGRGTIYHNIKEGLKKLREPFRKEILEPVYQIIIQTAFELLEDKNIIKITELKRELLERGLLSVADEDFLVPMLHFLEDVLGPNFKYVDLKSCRPVPHPSKVNIGLMRRED